MFVSGTGKRRGFVVPNTNSAAPVILLPKAGPFASLASTPVSGLSNITIDGGGVAPSSTYLVPLKYDTYQISSSSSVAVNPNAGWAFFAWTNHFVIGFDGVLSALGEDGQNGGAGCNPGGNGGDGGTGGGGGGSFYNPCCGCGSAVGGIGGNDVFEDGQGGDSIGASGGFGGIGISQTWAAGYAWPNGAASESGESGGAGFGGGGAGGFASPYYQCCVASASGGGGGGGGGKLICIVTNYTSFNATSSTLDVSGGLGGIALNNAANGYNGGKGSILIMTKQWSTPPTTINGNIEVWEIHANLSITRRLDYASASWDNN